MPAKKRPSLFVIDGSNNVYRSYYAIRNLTNSAGMATNAVYGFVTTLRHDLDYDRSPAAGRRTTDRTLAWTLGYRS